VISGTIGLQNQLEVLSPIIFDNRILSCHLERIDC